MNDREIKGLAIVGGALLLGFALLNGVYQAGVNAGLARDGDHGAWVGVAPRRELCGKCRYALGS